MSARDWLDPARLASRWTVAPAPPPPAPVSDPNAWCRRVRVLVTERLGAQSVVLRYVAELEAACARRFTPPSGAAGTDGAALDATIERLLVDIEDLLDAAALVEGRS